MIGLTFLYREGKEHLAGSTGPNFKIGNAVLIDFGRKQELLRIIPHEPLIAELHDSEPVVEVLKDGFLSLASEHMSQDKNRLPLALDAKVLQGSLGTRGPGELTG